KSLDRVEIAYQVAFLLHDRAEFVAQPQVQGESWSDTPVILREKCVPLVLQVPQQIPGCEPRPVHVSGEEVLQVFESDGTFGVGGDLVVVWRDKNTATTL